MKLGKTSNCRRRGALLALGVLGLYGCTFGSHPENVIVEPAPAGARSTAPAEEVARHPSLLPTPENLRVRVGRIPDASRSAAGDEACRDLRSAAGWLLAFFSEPVLLDEWQGLTTSPNASVRFVAEQVVLDLTGGDRLQWAARVFEEDPSGCHRCWVGLLLFQDRRGDSAGALPGIADRRRIQEALREAWRERGNKLRLSSIAKVRIWQPWASAELSFPSSRATYLLHREGVRWELLCGYKLAVF